MNVITRSRIRIAGLSLAGLFAMASFQNCGNVHFKDPNSSQSDSASTAESSGVEGAAGNAAGAAGSATGTANGSGTASGVNTNPAGANGGGNSATGNPSTTNPVVTPPLVSSLSASANPLVQIKGQNSLLSVTSQNLAGLTYACSAPADPMISFKGNINPASPKVQIPVNADLVCEVVGQAAAGSGIADQRAEVKIGMDCGNQIKVNGACIDFTCKSVVAITDAQLASVPARSADGICYSLKIAGAIANGKSSLTPNRDADLMSANHSGSGDIQPYQMSSRTLSFKLNGPRVVKLAGSGSDATTPIRVDNYVFFGIFPLNADLSDPAKYYKAQGTTDASVHDAQGLLTGNVLFHKQPIPLQSFGPGGTSSVAPINLSTAADVNVTNTLDVRTEDCGGSREQSDIYLLFQ